MSDAVAAVTAAAEAARRAHAQEVATWIAAAATVGEAGRRWLTVESQAARARLLDALEHHDRIGAAPSLFRLMGLSRREKPYNRVLGWILDPTQPHGAGRTALLAVARLLLPQLAEEIEAGKPVHVRVERQMPGLEHREPDLLVLTPTAALLIENKVEAGESGDDQYRDYAEGLNTLCARSDREHHAAWLLAPDERVCPSGEGWSFAGCKSHADLAKVLGQAASAENLPAWGRVVLLLTARQLNGSGPSPGDVARARELGRLESPTPSDVARMLHLADTIGRSLPPWRNDDDDME